MMISQLVVFRRVSIQSHFIQIYACSVSFTGIRLSPCTYLCKSKSKNSTECFSGNFPGKYSLISVNFHQNTSQFISSKIMASREMEKRLIFQVHICYFFSFHFEGLSPDLRIPQVQKIPRQTKHQKMQFLYHLCLNLGILQSLQQVSKHPVQPEYTQP